MADRRTRHTFALRGDDSQLTKTLRGAERKFRRFDKQVTTLGKASLAAFAPIAAGLAASTRLFADYEDSITRANILLGSTAAEQQKVADTARYLGATTQKSASDAADGFQFLALAGFSATKAIAALPGILQLSVIANEELGRTSDVTTDALTAMGLEATDTGRLVDLLTKAQGVANASALQFGESFITAGAAVQNMGIEVEDAATSIAIFANAGLKGESAGLLLSRVLTSLTDNAEDIREVTSELGNFTVEIFNSAGGVRDINDIFADFRKSISGVTDEQRINIISSLGSSRAIRGLSTILQTSQKDFDVLNESLKNSTGAANEFSARLESTLSARFKTLRSSVEEFGLSLAETFQEDLKEAVDGLTEFIRKTASFVSINKDAVKAIIANVIQIAKFVGLFFAATKAIGLTITAFKVFKAIFNPLTAVIFGFGKLIFTSLITPIFTSNTALAAYAVVTRTATAATKLFNLALKANPIGVLVTAALALIVVMSRLGGVLKAFSEGRYLAAAKEASAVAKEFGSNILNSFKDFLGLNPVEIETEWGDLPPFPDPNVKVKVDVEVDGLGKANNSLGDLGSDVVVAKAKDEEKGETKLNINPAKEYYGALKKLDEDYFRDKEKIAEEETRLTLDKQQVLIDLEEASRLEGNEAAIEALQDKLEALEEVEVEFEERKLERQAAAGELAELVNEDLAERQADYIEEKAVTDQEVQDDLDKSQVDRAVENQRKIFLAQKVGGQALANYQKLLIKDEFKTSEKALSALASLEGNYFKEVALLGKAARIFELTLNLISAPPEILAKNAKIPQPLSGILSGIEIAALIGQTVGAIGKLGSQIFKFQLGGLVPSTSTSRAGQDSVAAILTPGEIVIPATQSFNSLTAIAREQLRREEDRNNPTTQDVNVNSNVDISFTGDAVDIFEAQVVDRVRHGNSRFTVGN